MKIRVFSKIGTLLLVLFLCSVSFVVGRRSMKAGKSTVRLQHQMNELDRLQLETAAQK